MNPLHPRRILRLTLGALAKLVLKKHNPDVIVVTGDGQTSIVRECLYTILYENYPTRRNIEFPESEFSIPLTVFGELSYPKPRWKWIPTILKILALLIKVKPYKHILIIEISNLNREVYEFWIKVLKPKFVVKVPEKDLTNKETLPTAVLNIINDVIKFYEIQSDYLIAQLNKINLPSSRIKLRKGENNSLIIDSRHYYFPTPLTSIFEVASAFDGRKIIFTDIEDDLKQLKNQKDKWLINPEYYSSESEDVVVVRGDKTKISLKFLGIN